MNLICPIMIGMLTWNLDERLVNLGFSPINLTRVSARDIIGCGRRKIRQVQSSIENISDLLGHNTDGIIPRTSQLPCEMCT